MYTLAIGNYAYSSWSLRAWLFLAHHALPMGEVRIPLYGPGSKERILAYSPAGKVPVLDADGVRVWETLAILELLAERHPDLHGWPRDAQARAHARSISAEMHAGFAPLRSHCGMNVRKTFAPRAWPDDVMRDVSRIDTMWSDCRARFGGAGPFLYGAFTIADCMYAPVVWRMHTYALALSDASAAYRDTMLALPAMREWHARAIAEPEVLPQFEADYPLR